MDALADTSEDNGHVSIFKTQPDRATQTGHVHTPRRQARCTDSRGDEHPWALLPSIFFGCLYKIPNRITNPGTMCTMLDSMHGIVVNSHCLPLYHMFSASQACSKK